MSITGTLLNTVDNWHNPNIKGVKKVRRHYSKAYNFRSYDHPVIKLNRFQELLNIKVSTM